MCLRKSVITSCRYNFDTRKPILITFGGNVTEKVNNQKIFYFPTSRKYCFCTTWGNRKLENWVFSLKCCMLFCQQTHKTQNYHIVTAKSPSLSKWSTVCIIQDLGRKHSILQYVTVTLDVYQVCHGVECRIKNERCSSSSLEWKSMNSIAEISYYLNKS